MAESTQSIQNALRLRRRLTVTVPLSLMEVRQNLKQGLAGEIVLQGQWQLARRYWGSVSHDRLTLYGPRANRQFCFWVQGELKSRQRQTQFEGRMYLRAQDFYQLLLPLGFLLIGLPAMFRQASVLFLPLFLGFMYGMVQWHFEHYQGEIKRLLTDMMTQAEGTEVTAPMMGTFYRAAAPGQPSLVNIGDRVEVDQAIGIIAAMNLTNALQAKFAGEVAEILVADGEAVEFGQPLMRIREDL